MARRPIALAVAGGSGSGKTTLTRAIVELLGPDRCCVLEHDSYYHDLAHLPHEARAETNFDHPDSLDNALLARHLEALLAGRSIEQPDYDFASHTRRPRPRHVPARPVVICEGILLLADERLRRAFDLRVFVDAPADVRALRRVQRDIVERGRTVSSVVQQYLTTVRPMHERFVEPAKRSADLVLDWRRSAPEQALQVARRLHAGAGDALCVTDAE